jgi:hypothetical protein
MQLITADSSHLLPLVVTLVRHFNDMEAKDLLHLSEVSKPLRTLVHNLAQKKLILALGIPPTLDLKNPLATFGLASNETALRLHRFTVPQFQEAYDLLSRIDPHSIEQMRNRNFYLCNLERVKPEAKKDPKTYLGIGMKACSKIYAKAIGRVDPQLSPRALEFDYEISKDLRAAPVQIGETANKTAVKAIIGDYGKTFIYIDSRAPSSRFQFYMSLYRGFKNDGDWSFTNEGTCDYKSNPMSANAEKAIQIEFFKGPERADPSRTVMCDLTQIAVEILLRETDPDIYLRVSTNYNDIDVLVPAGFDTLQCTSNLIEEMKAARADGALFPAYRDRASTIAKLNKGSIGLVDFTLEEPEPWSDRIARHTILYGKGPAFPEYINRPVKKAAPPADAGAGAGAGGV